MGAPLLCTKKNPTRHRHPIYGIGKVQHPIHGIGKVQYPIYGYMGSPRPPHGLDIPYRMSPLHVCVPLLVCKMVCWLASYTIRCVWRRYTQYYITAAHVINFIRSSDIRCARCARCNCKLANVFTVHHQWNNILSLIKCYKDYRMIALLFRILEENHADIHVEG